MTVPARLAAAIEVFTELGWRDAELADTPQLPLGTAEQRRTALAGLRSGTWGEFGQIAERTYGWISRVDVDEAALALFAIRLGVDARRAAQILPSPHRVGDDLAADILAARGPDFARRFVDCVCASSRRAWEHATSVHAGVAVRLVAHHRLPVPHHVEYLKDWAVYALGALTGGGDLVPATRGGVDASVVADRYAEHARAAVAVGVPATGPFLETVMPALERGWIDRGEVVELGFAALDAVQRPGDRKAWLRLLVDDLAVARAEFVARADAMVSLMSFGDAFVVETLAPILVAGVDADVLADVLAVASAVPTKKARRAVLTAAGARRRPADAAVAAVAGLVADCAADGDRALSRAAVSLADAWGIVPAGPGPADSAVQGLWRPTPEVWQVPRFDPGEASVATVTDAAARLLRRGEAVVDLEVERFLALANRLAHDDADAARTALRGVGQNWIDGLVAVPAWVRGGENPLVDRDPDPDERWSHGTVWDVLRAREGAVVGRLGAVPVLLSTPSWVDLRIHPDDLLARLDTYAATGSVAAEPDLFAALTRLDLTLVDATHRERFAARAVPVHTRPGCPLPVAAGPAVAAYLDDPVVEPGLVRHPSARYWTTTERPVPASLAAFPRRLDHNGYRAHDPAAFPAWGDGAGLSVGFGDAASAGVLLRQMARRAVPLTPGLAINMLAAQRGFHRNAAADGATAVVEAWERGLLRPGVADVRFLDWCTVPTSLAAFARAGAELADEGLLSVLWPVFDDLVAASVRASRLAAGTADLVETLDRFLPETLAAVAAGIAGAEVLDLPGVRTLACRPGASRAVTAARALVGRLPAPTRERTGEAAPREVFDFDETWDAALDRAPTIRDGAVLTVSWIDAAAPTKRLAVDLVLPDRPRERFRVHKGWFYDIEHEGQCAATRFIDEAPPGGGHDQVWLRWDDAARTLTVDDTRAGGGPGVPPLTTSMVAVVLVGSCHDDPDSYAVESIVRRGSIGSAAVAVAVRALLTQPDVSPARLMRILEPDPSLLPVLWPVLVESVRHAAQLDGAAPRWLNRVLDVALRYAPLLREAARRGLIPADAAGWPGLAQLAARPGRTAASAKAKASAAELLPSAERRASRPRGEPAG